MLRYCGRRAPSAVVLELCSMRIGMLTPHSTPVASSSSDKSLAVVAGGVGSVLSDWTPLIRMSYQLLEDSLEVPQAGSEFRAAADEAKTLGAEVVLGDRSMEVTRLRLKRLIPLYELIMAMVVEDSEWTRGRALHGMPPRSSFSARATSLRRQLARRVQRNARRRSKP